MQTLRSIITGLLGTLCVIAMPILIWTATLQLTLLDKTVVKGWLSTTSIYEKLLPTITTSTPITETTIAPTQVQAALEATYTPAYLQTQTETALDGVYNWLEGKTPEVQYSLPINEKRDTFVEQLAKELQPTIAELPACTTQTQLQALDGSCRPPFMTTTETARLAAEKATTQADNILGQPFTPQTLEQQDPELQQETNQLRYLPSFMRLADMAIVVLPFVIVVSILGIALVSNHRLRAFRRLSQQLFLSTVLTGIVAGLCWYASTQDLIPAIGGPAGEWLQPVFTIAVGAIAGWLLLFTGTVLTISGLGWIIFGILDRRARQQPPAPPLPVTPSA